MPFEKGVSGNPSGRPRGVRNRTTAALEQILEGDAEAILRKAVSLSLAGDPAALRMCLERLLPVRRDRTVQFDLPPIETAADLTKATDALLRGVADGDLTPAEASDLAKMVQAHIEAIRTVELNERLQRLEAAEDLGERA